MNEFQTLERPQTELFVPQYGCGCKCIKDKRTFKIAHSNEVKVELSSSLLHKAKQDFENIDSIKDDFNYFEPFLTFITWCCFICICNRVIGLIVMREN